MCNSVWAAIHVKVHEGNEDDNDDASFCGIGNGDPGKINRLNLSIKFPS